MRIESTNKIIAKSYPIYLKIAKKSLETNNNMFDQKEMAIIGFTNLLFSFEGFINLIIEILVMENEKVDTCKTCSWNISAKYAKITSFFSTISFDQFQYHCTLSKKDFTKSISEIQKLFKQINKEINNDIKGFKSNIKRNNVSHGKVNIHTEYKVAHSLDDTHQRKIDFYFSSLIDDFHIYGINFDIFKKLYHLFSNFMEKTHCFFKKWVNDFTLNMLVDNTKLHKGDYLSRLSLLHIFINTPYDKENELISGTQTYFNE